MVSVSAPALEPGQGLALVSVRERAQESAPAWEQGPVQVRASGLVSVQVQSCDVLVCLVHHLDERVGSGVRDLAEHELADVLFAVAELRTVAFDVSTAEHAALLEQPPDDASALDGIEDESQVVDLPVADALFLFARLTLLARVRGIRDQRRPRHAVRFHM